MANIILKLEVEQMRTSVMQAFVGKSAEIQDAVGKSLHKFLEGFNFDEAVTREADIVMRELVRKAMTESVTSVLADPVIDTMLRAAAVNKVRKAIETSLMENTKT
jgi:hypothetical protein